MPDAVHAGDERLSSALKVMPFAAGKDYDVVLVSFDPRDTPAIAAEKKRAHLEYWSTERDGAAWHLLTRRRGARFAA